MPEFTIKPVQSAVELESVGTLFLAYATWLEQDHGITLEFQNFEVELASLPGKYAPPAGGLFVAEGPEAELWGCAAFRPLDGTVCEIKRLYVVPEARGKALGRCLVAHTLDSARAAGYTRAVLDTGGFMKSAQALYAAFGFEDIPAYYHNPIEGVRYMGADL